MAQRASADTLTTSRRGTPGDPADREVLAALPGHTLTRGVLCAMERPVPADAAALCRTARRVAVLENIVDTTNLGAIFRSAAALHVDAVLLSPSCCDPLGRRSLRVSMGTVFQVPWAVLPGGPEEGLARLHQPGRPARPHHRRLCRNGAHPHVPRGGFPQRGGGRRRGLLGDPPPTRTGGAL